MSDIESKLCGGVEEPDSPKLDFNEVSDIPDNFDQYLEAMNRIADNVRDKRRQLPLPEFVRYLDIDVIAKLRELQQKQGLHQAVRYTAGAYAAVFERYRDAVSACLSQAEETKEERRAYERFREKARKSIVRFLTGQEFDNKPEVQRNAEAWADAIVAEIEANKLPFTAEVVSLVLTVIKKESGFSVVPKFILEGDAYDLYEERKAAEKAEHPALFTAIEKTGLIDKFEKKYKARLRGVTTEKQVEELAAEVLRDPMLEEIRYVPMSAGDVYKEIKGELTSLADEVKGGVKSWLGLSDDEPVNDPVGKKAATEDGNLLYRTVRSQLASMVETIGSMQVNVAKARQMAAEEGRTLTDAQMRTELYTMRGGLHYGIKILATAIRAYAGKTPDSTIKINEQSAKQVLADYNGGLFSCRNASIQMQLTAVTGEDLDRDGDLLRYNADATPSEDVSSTEEAFRDFAKREKLGMSDEQIRAELVLEKTPQFEGTRLYSALRAAYKRKTRKEPQYALWTEAVVPIKKSSDKWGKKTKLSAEKYKDDGGKLYRSTLYTVKNELPSNPAQQPTLAMLDR